MLKPPPDARNSIASPGSIFHNNHGLIVPNPQFAAAFQAVVIACFIAVVVTIAFYIWSKKQQERTGTQYPNDSITLALILGVPLLVLIHAGQAMVLDLPQQA